SIKPDEGAAPADLFVDVDIRIHQVAEMSDHDVLRLDAGVLEDVELFERRLSRNARVSEDRKVRRDVRLPHRTKHFSLISGDLVPRPNLAEYPQHIVVGLFDERLHNLLLAHRGDLFRVERLRIEAATRDDWDARLHRHLTDEVDVSAHVGVPGVDDAREVAV